MSGQHLGINGLDSTLSSWGYKILGRISTANALGIWGDCRNYNTTEHKCDNSTLPNQQQSVTRIAKRGVPQIDEDQLLDGLL